MPRSRGHGQDEFPESRRDQLCASDLHLLHDAFNTARMGWTAHKGSLKISGSCFCSASAVANDSGIGGRPLFLCVALMGSLETANDNAPLAVVSLCRARVDTLPHHLLDD